MDDPQIAVFVMIDEYENTALGGGTTGRAHRGHIMADILPYLGVEPQYTAEELPAGTSRCRRWWAPPGRRRSSS